MFHELTSCNKRPLADPVKEHPEGRRVEERARRRAPSVEDEAVAGYRERVEERARDRCGHVLRALPGLLNSKFRTRKMERVSFFRPACLPFPAHLLDFYILSLKYPGTSQSQRQCHCLIKTKHSDKIPTKPSLKYVKQTKTC